MDYDGRLGGWWMVTSPPYLEDKVDIHISIIFPHPGPRGLRHHQLRGFPPLLLWRPRRGLRRADGCRRSQGGATADVRERWVPNGALAGVMGSLMSGVPGKKKDGSWRGVVGVREKGHVPKQF